jgi:hypothetical protein
MANPEPSGVTTNMSDPAAENKLQPKVVLDEYGDPVIEGTYAGQDQPDYDALFPGRKEENEGEEETLEEQESADDDGAKKRVGHRGQIILVGSILMCTLIAFSWIIHLHAVRKIQESTVGTFVYFTAKKLPAGGDNIDNLIAAGSERYNHGDYTGAQIGYQQAFAIVSTRDEAMRLMSAGDRFMQEGKPRIAEQFYRRAIAVLGSSTGSTSWEYMQALTRLAFLCHKLNRFQEEEEIVAYIRRLSQQ